MKIRGRIKGIPVLILIDSGASHNFISLRVVNSLGLGYGHSTATTVKLGDGEVDLILGIEWLATLGEVTTDWKKNVMKFEYEGRKIEFEGEDSEGGKQDSLLCFLNQELQEIDGLMWPSNIQKA
ncbi:Aspartic peptidase domain superfamily, partial [Sesbania bispinosa]